MPLFHLRNHMVIELVQSQTFGIWFGKADLPELKTGKSCYVFSAY